MLKKLIAILLLAIQLFNLAGYSLVFRYFITQSEQKFVKQLDERQYNDADLVLISVPLNLPYMQNWTEFERVDGMVEMEGVTYNYVKRRVFNDTLYVMCLPNQQRNQLVKAKSIYAAEVNDFANTDSKKQKEHTPKKAGYNTDYDYHITNYSLVLSDVVTVCTKYNNASALPPAAIIDTPEHPPQLHC
jgi:hypothetical protein